MLKNRLNWKQVQGNVQMDQDMSIVRKGIVISGEFSGWEIVVADDRNGDTGGYYLYLKKSDIEAFDYWFEHEAELHVQIDDFEVEWLV